MVRDMGRAARLIFFTIPAFLCTFLCMGAAVLAGEPELIERLPGPIDDHTIVMLDESRTMVAWERDDTRGQETVWASRRNAAGRWSVPENVEFSQGHANAVQLAADGEGAVIVIWIQQELNLSGLWANRYIPDKGWQEPVRVESVAGELYAPQFALDANGRGFAIWERRRGDRFGVRASRYTPDRGWSAPRDIDAGAGESVAPRLAVHVDGSAIAAWTRRDSSGASFVVAARFVPNAGWGPPEKLSVVGGIAHDVQVATDAHGNAMVAWEQVIQGEETIFARRFEAAAGWRAPVQLEIDGEEGYGPKLAVSPDGSAVVVWIRAKGETGTIVAARYTVERGWDGPLTVHGGALLYLFDLHVAASVGGGALATWCQTDGSRNNVWYARFEPDTGWRTPILAEKRTGSTHRPRAAANSSGSFGLIWKSVEAPLPEHAMNSLWFRRIP
jgi:hypothetical protein